MAYVAPTTRSDGYIVAASQWNQDVVNNILYLKNAPTFDGAVIVTGALTSGAINGQTISSAASFTGTLATAGDVQIGTSGTGATNALLLDGAATGQPKIDFKQNGTVRSFIQYADSTSFLQIGGAFGNVLRVGAASGLVTFGSDIAVAATKKLYLDGIAATGDTHIAESSANTIALTSGGVAITIVSGVLSSTLQLEAATAGTVVSSFVNGLKIGGFDIVGYDSGGTKAVFGGYRGSTWTSLGLYTSGTERLTISTTGVVTLSAYTAATFAAGDKYLVVNATGVIHVSALGPAS